MANTSAFRGPTPSGASRDSSFFTKTYNSFSGVDMVVTMGGKQIGELQGISYTIQREKAPIYTLGLADPRSFSRGKRGIAGSLVFVVFDRSALLEAMRDRPYIANRYEPPTGFEIGPIEDSLISLQAGLSTSVASSTITVKRVQLDKVLARPQYLDQVLPFDIVITAANEYGHFARMVIGGVEILNQGSSLSSDDISTDEACTFIATNISPWKDQGYVRVNDDGKTTTVV